MKYFDFVKLQSESADLWIRGESFTTEVVVNVMCDGDLSTCERIFTHRQRILRPRIVYVWETRCSLTWCISNARSIFVAMRDSDIAFCAILYWMLATWPNYNFWRSFHLGSHIMSLIMTLDVKSCPAARKFYRPSGNKLGSSIGPCCVGGNQLLLIQYPSISLSCFQFQATRIIAERPVRVEDIVSAAS